MKLSYPIAITPSLRPGVNIGDAWVSIDYSTRPGRDGRVRYEWEVILPGGERFTGDDLQSGCGGGSLREGMSSLLAFLGAFAEAHGYARRTGREWRSENADLFPAAMAEWATENSDDISLASLEVEENPDCIDEG